MLKELSEVSGVPEEEILETAKEMAEELNIDI